MDPVQTSETPSMSKMSSAEGWQLVGVLIGLPALFVFMVVALQRKWERRRDS